MLGRGRVAEVFEISDPPEAASLALKLFHGPVPDETIRLVDFAQLRRLDQLVAVGLAEDDAYPLVASPKCLVYAALDGTTPIGLAVLRTDISRFLPLASWLLSSKIQTDLKFCVTAATRLAEAVAAVHECGFVVGDVSGANVLVDSEGFCNLIDVDSFGVVAPGGAMILKPGFATSNFFAPELPAEGPSLATDRFSLGLIITQFLLGGMHPFGGSHRTQARDQVQANISARESWLFSPQIFTLPADQGDHLGLDCIPQWIHPNIRAALLGDAEERPPAGDWRVTLLRSYTQIEGCLQCEQDRFRGAVCRNCGEGARGSKSRSLRRSGGSPAPKSVGPRPRESGSGSGDPDLGWPTRARVTWPLVVTIAFVGLVLAALLLAGE